MERRKVTVWVDGQPCCFYTDDSEEYIAALAERANAVMRRTAADSGTVGQTKAVFSVLALTDTLLRTEQRMRDLEKGLKEAGERTPAERKHPMPRKAAAKAPEEDPGQVSVWDLLK